MVYIRNKKMPSIMFLFIIVLYVLACVYVGRRIVKIATTTRAKVVTICSVVLLSILFFIQRAVVGVSPQWINQLLYVVSTMWLVVIMYGSMLFIVFDIARLIARIRTGQKQPYKRGNIIGVVTLLTIILLVGFYNAKNPIITQYSIKLSQLNRGDTLRIAITSDLHMGYGVTKSDIENLRDLINSTNADAFIIAGDLFDGDTSPVLYDNIGEPLSGINCRYGTFAVVGNHEYMGNVEVAKNYIRGLGITLLCDSVASTDKFSIIGRNDVSANFRMFGMPAKSDNFKDLKPDNDSTMLIVVDHQPGRIDESIDINADIHISGHTHAGQVWPMRFLTRLAFKQDYGYQRYEHTHAIVTSGFGTWGPRIRLGCSPEIVVLNITGY